MQCVDRVVGWKRIYLEEDNAFRVSNACLGDVNTIKRKRYICVLQDKLKRHVLTIMTVMQAYFVQHKIFGHILVHAQSSKLHMSHAIQQKNANIIYIAGIQCLWKRIKKV